MTGVCAVCGKQSDTVKYCSLCEKMIGDCCRNKPIARAVAATGAAMKRAREAFGLALKKAG